MSPLRTVRVPTALEPLFERAEALVSSYFARRTHDPAHGRIEVDDQRYVLVRAASLSVEFFALVEDLFGSDRSEEARDFARNILFDLAHAIGRTDAQRFHERMHLDDPIARLAAGPVHFAHAGWASVDIDADSRPVPDESYYLRYDHPYSFEADAWIEAGRETAFPVCIMNAGYSSGWCEESFGMHLVSSEVLCRARGDEACRFIMAHPSAIESYVEEYAVRMPHLAARIRTYEIPDFFARKRMEDELRNARDELELRVRARTSELQEAYERIHREMRLREQMESELIRKHKLEALGRLAGGIAHDFNNLMTVVIGFSSMLEGRFEQDPKISEQLGMIRNAGERAATISQQLLAFGRSQVLRPEVLDMREAVGETARLLDRVIGEDVVLDVTLGTAPCPCFVDRSQVTQILLNLALNSRDAMPTGGSLRVELERIDDSGVSGWVRLRVTDTGAGMTRETMRRAFDPFFTTKDEGSGTGLGLSTVYGIVEQSGGRIEVSSPEAGGARFDVYFPLADEALAAAPEPPRDPVTPGGDETVLVVEDQEGPRRLMVRVLGELGYRVFEAPGAAQALALAARVESIDLLLSDVIMPGASGPELARELRSRGFAGSVLYVSGFADGERLRRGGTELDANVLRKPFSPASLGIAVREAIDRRPAQRSRRPSM